MEIQELKQKIEFIKSEATNLNRFRYPKSIKQEIKQFVDDGMNIQKLSRILNIPHQTIRNWYKPKRVKSKFNKLKIINRTQKFSTDLNLSTKLVLKTKNDFEISNLNFVQLKELLSRGLL
jgi:DNA-binding transcriptional regulator YiaG